MFFSTIKKCNDDRVIKTGLDAITECQRRKNIKKWNIILRISLMQNAENIANISSL